LHLTASWAEVGAWGFAASQVVAACGGGASDKTRLRRTPGVYSWVYVRANVKGRDQFVSI